jgi:glycosyltransferase involved in cell wall biosynthesis
MSERPRVLQVGIDPSFGGGMAAAVSALLSSPLAEPYRLETLYTYSRTDPLGRLVVFVRALLRIAGWSLRRRGRIVHVHATVRGSAYRKSLCVLLAKALRRRVVIQVHSGPGDIAAFRAGLGRPSRGLFRCALGSADAVLAVSGASAAALAEAGVRGEIGVVPNPAPPVPAFERAEPGDGRLHVAYLGGFSNPAKGGDVLLEALEGLLPGDSRLRVSLAGPGELPAQAQALCERVPAVEWAGWLDAAAKDELLRDATVLVMPSRSEGLPMAMLEAMAYGMAILATNVGGIPEVIEDGVEGLLVPAKDPAVLAKALSRLAAEPELRARLAVAARARAERLDAVEVAGRLEALYARLS